MEKSLAGREKYREISANKHLPEGGKEMVKSVKSKHAR